MVVCPPIHPVTSTFHTWQGRVDVAKQQFKAALAMDDSYQPAHGGLGVAVTTDVTALVLTKELVHRVTAELPTLRTFAVRVGSLLYVDPDLIAL